ncbi:hypothetical protein [Senegalia sp. (in: firmicutes)]|uniref:hypothetical protein n=1 Tax=Senegalia sp. (in: firmicutes) TaxID=1924098 RepID=UPI003F985A5C
MKKTSKVLVILIILLLFPQKGQAVEVELDNAENIKPLFTNINIFQSTFDIASDGKSSNTVYLNSRNSSKVKINAYLQQYKGGRWTTIKSWSGSRNSTSYGFTKNWYVNKGYSYRLLSYGYVYKNNKIVESTSNVSRSIYY